MANYKATYKRFNGVSWDEYYFKTKADMVEGLDTELSQVYGGKNLASPDLQGKEYLGDGVYRLYNANGITLNYNVYSGVYNINGDTPVLSGTAFILIFNNLNIPLYSIYTYEYIGGTIVGDEPFLRTSHHYTDEKPINYNAFSPYNNTKNIIQENFRQFRIYLQSGKTYIFDNYQFTIQLEKGDTATPYTLPIQPIIYHELTSGEWITPTLLNGWTNVASNELQYRKHLNGNVQLRGHLNGGTIGTVITTLPAGYRPLKTTYFICSTDLTIGSGTIGTNGNITLIQGDLTNVRLDNISFTTL